MEDKNLLTVDEAAEILGVHPMTVYQAIRQNRLPHTLVFGRKVVNRNDVLAYKQRTRPEGVKRVGRPPRKQTTERTQ